MKYLTDFAISHEKTAQMSLSLTPFLSLASPLPPSHVFRGLGPCFKPSNLGAQAHLYQPGEKFVLLYLCCPSNGEPPTQQEQWMNLSRCRKAHKRAGMRFLPSSLSHWAPTQEGYFAALVHIAELDAWAQEGREGERVVYGVPSTFLRAVQAWLLCSFKKGLFTLLQAGIYATAPAGNHQSPT